MPAGMRRIRSERTREPCSLRTRESEGASSFAKAPEDKLKVLRRERRCLISTRSFSTVQHWSSVVLIFWLVLAGCSSDPLPNRSEPQASYVSIQASSFKQSKFHQGKSNYSDFFQRLNYDHPILGVRLPLEVEEPGDIKPGLVEIEEARIEPSGKGPWKSSWNPVLKLRGVRIMGSDLQIHAFIRKLSRAQSGGVEIQNLEIKDSKVPGVVWTASRALASHGGLLLEGGLRNQGSIKQPVSFFGCRASEKPSSSDTKQGGL